MVVESSSADPGVSRAATGSAVVVFIGTVAGSLLQGSLSDLDVGVLPSGLIAAGLGLALFVYQRALGREAKARRAVALQTAAHTRQISFDPRSVAFMAVLVLLFIEFATGVVVGFSLSGIDLSEQEILGALGLIILPVLLLAAGLVGWYMSLRIVANEFAWIAGTLALARVLSALMAFAISFEQPIEVGEILAGALFLYALSLGAAWLGHVLAKKREDVFTVAYLTRLLDHEDRVALIDLVAKAAEQTDSGGTQPSRAASNRAGRSHPSLCTSCGAGMESGAAFCGRCGTKGEIAHPT